MPERIYSEGLVLPDGRKVRVLAYDDGSVRFRLDGTPYVMEEAFLSGGRQDHAIIKLSKKNGAVPDPDEDGGDPLSQFRATVAGLKNQLDQVTDDSGPGARVRKHQREGMNSMLVVLLSLIDDARDVNDDDG